MVIIEKKLYEIYLNATDPHGKKKMDHIDLNGLHTRYSLYPSSCDFNYMKWYDLFQVQGLQTQMQGEMRPQSNKVIE